VEQGENKSALVKVALCERCVKKLMWKRQKEKEMKATAGLDFQTVTSGGNVLEDFPAKRRKKISMNETPATRSRASSTIHLISRTSSNSTKFGDWDLSKTSTRMS
jgi:Folate-sensitive fragile site protein Fra10Ac1